ncbi:hypothetical protein PFISCL1PPCAC_13293, partial [Pristionchus fissidentatus]
MLPHSGIGVLWDKPSFDYGSQRAETTVFVPESGKFANVSISLRDTNKADLTVTAWIRWTAVGVRDAARPAELIGVRVMTREEEKPLHIEYQNETTFKTAILFPTRPDHIAFVGEKNGWSPDVGIVSCEGVSEALRRGVHCSGYVVRDYNRSGSAFTVNESTLKYPEGFGSDEERRRFEELENMIDSAMGEAAMLEEKGWAPPVAALPTASRPRGNGNQRTGQYDNSRNGRGRGGGGMR